MGIDFLICNNCRDTFPDCGTYVQCNDGCYNRWCSEECAKEEGYKEEGEYDKEYEEWYPTCSYCRNEVAADKDLFSFALKKLGLSRDTLQKEYLSK